MAAVEKTAAWANRLGRLVAKREKAQALALTAQEDLYDAMLDVFDSGAGNYDDIAAAVGLSRIRVGQALRAARKHRGLEVVTCGTQLKDGKTCTATTSHASGICWAHRELVSAS